MALINRMDRITAWLAVAALIVCAFALVLGAHRAHLIPAERSLDRTHLVTQGGVAREVRVSGCEAMRTCPSAIESVAYEIFRVLTGVWWFAPACVGFLMGLAIGGFSTRTVRRGIQLGIVSLVGFGIAVALLARSLAGMNQGFGGRAAAAILIYSVGAALIWVPCFVLAISFMNTLKAALR